MLTIVVITLIVIMVSVGLVLVAQALRVQSESALREKQRLVASYARHRDGVLTPELVAEEFQMPVAEADAILRSMVDDVHMRMAVDDREGVLKFWFTRLRMEPEDNATRPAGPSTEQRVSRRRNTTQTPKSP